jgi:hypothetical protein
LQGRPADALFQLGYGLLVQTLQTAKALAVALGADLSVFKDVTFQDEPQVEAVAPRRKPGRPRKEPLLKWSGPLHRYLDDLAATAGGIAKRFGAGETATHWSDVAERHSGSATRLIVALEGVIDAVERGLGRVGPVVRLYDAILHLSEEDRRTLFGMLGDEYQ